MDRLVGVLALLLALLLGAVVSLLLSTPLGALAIWRYAKTRRWLHLGASVGDENAGTAALFVLRR